MIICYYQLITINRNLYILAFITNFDIKMDEYKTYQQKVPEMTNDVKEKLEQLKKKLEVELIKI